MFQCYLPNLSHPVLLQLFPHSWVVFFFIWSSMSYLLFCKLTPCLLHHLQISSLTLYVVFSFIVSFAVQKLLILIRSHLFVSIFISITLGDEPQKILL